MIRCLVRVPRLVHICGRSARQLGTSAGSKVPSEPTWNRIDPSSLPEETVLESELVDHLERLALVDFSNQEGIERLSAAIRFADQLQLVDTTGVEPMETVLEDRSLFLREDEVTEGDCREDVMKNASKTEEDYYVAPPGNIPLERKDRSYITSQQDDS